ncbi:MAG: flippase-like domain-containing protein [Chloroflexi bacterium]|nr:flippase-like domain-containing protein [Chloroflexota bacterium]
MAGSLAAPLGVELCFCLHGVGRLDFLAGTQVDVTVAQSWSSLRPRLKRLFPYIVTGLIVWLLLRQIQLRTIWHLLAKIDVRWLLVGFGWYLLTNILRSYRFGTLMGISGVKRPLRLLPEMISLSFMNNVLPARSGELSFPYLMQRRHNTPVGDSLTFLLIARIFDLLSVTTLFVVFAFLERSQLGSMAGQVMAGISLLVLPALFILAALPWLGTHGLWVSEQVLRHFRVDECKWGQWTLAHGRRVVAAMTQTHQARAYGLVFVWSILGWLATFAWFAAFLQAIHIPVRYPLVIVGAAFATISKAIPFLTVSGFGAHEAGWTLGFSLAGMSLETAVASGFAVNILTLLASFVFVSGMFLYEKFDLPRKSRH